MKILILLILFTSSFANGSSYFWSCGDTAGSRNFWDKGTTAGSKYYWNNGEGPGSRYYWLQGTGYGSKYYYLRNEGAWTNYSYQQGTSAGSYYFWNNGSGPGSRYFFNNGAQASADGIITSLCMNNLITHPLCVTLRMTPNNQNHYCIARNLNQFEHLQRLIILPTVHQLECEEVNGF